MNDIATAKPTEVKPADGAAPVDPKETPIVAAAPAAADGSDDPAFQAFLKAAEQGGPVMGATKELQPPGNEEQPQVKEPAGEHVEAPSDGSGNAQPTADEDEYERAVASLQLLNGMKVSQVKKLSRRDVFDLANAARERNRKIEEKLQSRTPEVQRDPATAGDPAGAQATPIDISDVAKALAAEVGDEKLAAAISSAIGSVVERTTAALQAEIQKLHSALKQQEDTVGVFTKAQQAQEAEVLRTGFNNAARSLRKRFPDLDDHAKYRAEVVPNIGALKDTPAFKDRKRDQSYFDEILLASIMAARWKEGAAQIAAAPVPQPVTSGNGNGSRVSGDPVYERWRKTLTPAS